MREFARARAGNEPRREYLTQLRQEIRQHQGELREGLIEHEALLRAAGKNTEEVAAAQRTRRELVPGWRGRWVSDRRVAQRSAVWGKVLNQRESEATTTLRVHDLKHDLEAKETAHPHAVQEFKNTVLEVIGKRLAGVEHAKTPDRDAYEAGLAERREAMRAASRKALESADAVQKAAFTFRDEVLRRTSETDPVIGRGASDAEVNRLVREGSAAERAAAMPEWMTRRDPDERTPRETQMMAYVLTEFGPADMKGGEGKTLLMVMAGYRDAREHGVATTLTSSDPLVVDMMDEVRTYLGDHHPDTGVDLVQLRENEPFPQAAWDAVERGRNLLVVGTKEGMLFVGLREAHAMVEQIGSKAPPSVVTGLKEWLRTEPHMDEVTDRLNALAREYGVLDERAGLDAQGKPRFKRFTPVPEGVGNFDEVDTAFDGQSRAILSPGARPDAEQVTVAHLNDVYATFRLAMLEHGLTDTHFARPDNTRGLWHARMSPEALGKLAAASGEPTESIRAQEKHYTQFALARWGLQRNTDFLTSREHDKVMLINAKTTDKLSWDRDKSTETRLQELGQYLDITEGVTVRGNNPQDSLTASMKQWIGSRFLKNPKGVSGTAKEVEEVMYQGWSGPHDTRGDYFGVPEIPRYYTSKLEEQAPTEYKNIQAKLEGMATEIVDGAKISFIHHNGTITGIRQEGRPQWDIMLDNKEIRGADERVTEQVVHTPGGGREVQETRTALNHWRDKQLHERGVTDWVDAIVERRLQQHAHEHGLHIADGVKLAYTAIDAGWHKEHGGGDTAEKAAAELVKKFGKPGSIMFINKSGGRGTDPKPTAESIELGGVITRISGGPAFSRRVVLQAIWRSARGGSGADREHGGTPGSAKMYTSPEDFRSEIEDAQATLEITRYLDATEERDHAATEYDTHPSTHNQHALEQADQHVQARGTGTPRGNHTPTPTTRRKPTPGPPPQTTRQPPTHTTTHPRTHTRRPPRKNPSLDSSPPHHLIPPQQPTNTNDQPATNTNSPTPAQDSDTRPDTPDSTHPDSTDNPTPRTRRRDMSRSSHANLSDTASTVSDSSVSDSSVPGSSDNGLTVLTPNIRSRTPTLGLPPHQHTNQ